MSSALGPWWGSGWGGRRGGGGDWFGGDDLWDPFDFGRSWNWDRRPTGAGGRGGDETTGALIPTNVDWCETPEAHIIRADLPGMKNEEVKVQLEDENVLQISGERKEEKEEGTDKWHRVERRSGGFLRRFRLPENANTHAINCGLERGVLTVTIPKKETQPTTRNLRNIDVA